MPTNVFNFNESNVILSNNVGRNNYVDNRNILIIILSRKLTSIYNSNLKKQIRFI